MLKNHANMDPPCWRRLFLGKKFELQVEFKITFFFLFFLFFVASLSRSYLWMSDVYFWCTFSLAIYIYISFFACKKPIIFSKCTCPLLRLKHLSFPNPFMIISWLCNSKGLCYFLVSLIQMCWIILSWGTVNTWLQN